MSYMQSSDLVRVGKAVLQAVGDEPAETVLVTLSVLVATQAQKGDITRDQFLTLMAAAWERVAAAKGNG